MRIFKNKSRLDFQYIVVEIILVTVGILIAIAIDNWNSSRLTQLEVDDYLFEIHSEIEVKIRYQEKSIEAFESMSNSLLRAMKIIERNDVDSIPYLKSIIWPLAQIWPVEYKLPILEEFIDKDYLNVVQDDSLKQVLKKYKKIKEGAQNMAEFDRKWYLDKVESWINKNVEYLEIRPSTTYTGYIFNDRNINNHPRIKTNFEGLFNDLEFWNLLTLKTETLLINLQRVKFDKRRFVLIEKKLRQYLENKD